jgi:protein phosphatase
MDPDKTDEIRIDEIKKQASNAVREKLPRQEVGWVLDKGKIRDSNEDSLAAVTLNEASNFEVQSVGIYAVADGMGGHDAGEVASKLAMHSAVHKIMQDLTEASDGWPENIPNWLRSAVTLANQKVRSRALERDRNMGTTLVMAVVVGHSLHIVNVGDSRAYLISPKTVRQITRDHSFVQALVDTGAITAEEAVGHPRRNILTQSVGSHDELTIDLFNETLKDDEWLLLCSDGLWGTMNNEQIGAIVRNAVSVGDAAQALVNAANEAGGQDNIAAVVVRLQPSPKSGSDEFDLDNDDTLSFQRPIIP